MEHIVGIVKARRESLIFTVGVLVAEVRITLDNDNHWKRESDILQHRFNHITQAAVQDVNRRHVG